MLDAKESGVIPLRVLRERFDTLIVLIDELIERIKKVDPTSPITALQIGDTIALTKRIAREQVEFGLPFFVDVLASKHKDFVGFATGNPLVRHGVAHSTAVTISGHLGNGNEVSISIIVDDLKASVSWLRNEVSRLQGHTAENGGIWTEQWDSDTARQKLTAMREVYDKLRDWFRLSLAKGNVENSITIGLIREMLIAQKKFGMPFVITFHDTKDNDIRFFFSSLNSSQQVAIVPHKLPKADLQSLPSIIDAFNSLIRFLDARIDSIDERPNEPSISADDDYYFCKQSGLFVRMGQQPPSHSELNNLMSIDPAASHRWLSSKAGKAEQEQQKNESQSRADAVFGPIRAELKALGLPYENLSDIVFWLESKGFNIDKMPYSRVFAEVTQARLKYLQDGLVKGMSEFDCERPAVTNVAKGGRPRLIDDETFKVFLQYRRDYESAKTIAGFDFNNWLRHKKINAKEHERRLNNTVPSRLARRNPSE